MVQPWTKFFSSSQPYPSNVVVWIRLLGVLGFLYRRRIIKSIWKMIRQVGKLDENTSSAHRGRFVRMGILLDLNKMLVSKIKVDGCVQHVEYESLPNICFACGHFGHLKDSCSSVSHHVPVVREMQWENQILVKNRKDSELFGPWMVVNQQNGRFGRKPVTGREERKVTDSMAQFNVLHDSRDENQTINGESNPADSAKLKGKAVTIYNNPLGEDESTPMNSIEQNRGFRNPLLSTEKAILGLEVGHGKPVKAFGLVNPKEVGPSKMSLGCSRPNVTVPVASEL